MSEEKNICTEDGKDVEKNTAQPKPSGVVKLIPKLRKVSPVSAPKPVLVPKPVSVSEPVSAPKPVLVPKPVSVSEPVSEPAAEPAAEPAPAPVPDKDELQAGTLIGGFEIIRKLGKGGMGTVYLAEQKSMQRQIALKVLNPEITKDAESVKQFLNEVRNTGKLQHPNIVNAFDSGEENGVYYLAMQYINGDTFDDLLQQKGAMDEIKVLEYAVQLAGALEYVWSKYQMFHRDIKPGNFMLNDDGKAMLMDLGIAQKIGETSADQDHVEGSPYYMSPEQIQGGALSWTTDQYSLGASLYQMIVGVPPYDDKTIDDILKKHCLAEFPEPAERKPGCKISPETVAILKRMLDKDAAKRFSSWEEFITKTKECIELLKEIEKNPEKRLEIDAAAAAEAKRLRDKKKKILTAIWLSAAALIVVGGGVGGYFFLSAQNTAHAEAMAKTLEETYRKFTENPATHKQMEACLDQAQSAASRLFVQSDLADKLSRTAADLEKKYKTLTNSYLKFERDSAACKKEEDSVKADLSALAAGRGLSYDSVEAAAGKLTILGGHVSGLQPATPAQKELKQRIASAVDVMKKTLEQCRQKVSQQEQARSQAMIDEINRQTNQQNAAAAQKINAELARKEAEEKRLADQAYRKAKEEERRRNAVKNTPAKQLGTNQVPMIQKETNRIRSEFLNAIMNVDVDRAVAIEISQEVRELEIKDAKSKAAYAALEKEYRMFKAMSSNAAVVWKALNNLDNMLYIRGIPVRTTVLNNRLRLPQLKVEKVSGGKVYFQEADAQPEDFIYLWREDKNRIARTLIQRTDLVRYAASFYFFFGMYDLAYEAAPEQEQKQILVLAKQIVKMQYQAAKTKGDIQVQQRLRRDYGNNKAMSDIFK